MNVSRIPKPNSNTAEFGFVLVRFDVRRTFD